MYITYRAHRNHIPAVDIVRSKDTEQVAGALSGREKLVLTVGRADSVSKSKVKAVEKPVCYLAVQVGCSFCICSSITIRLCKKCVNHPLIVTLVLSLFSFHKWLTPQLITTLPDLVLRV